MGYSKDIPNSEHWEAFIKTNASDLKNPGEEVVNLKANFKLGSQDSNF